VSKSVYKYKKVHRFYLNNIEYNSNRPSLY